MYVNWTPRTANWMAFAYTPELPPRCRGASPNSLPVQTLLATSCKAPNPVRRSCFTWPAVSIFWEETAYRVCITSWIRIPDTYSHPDIPIPEYQIWRSDWDSWEFLSDVKKSSRSRDMTNCDLHANKAKIAKPKSEGGKQRCINNVQPIRGPIRSPRQIWIFEFHIINREKRASTNDVT